MQFLLFFILLAAAAALMAGLFWVLFKKDAPPIHEIERRLQQRRRKAHMDLYL